MTRDNERSLDRGSFLYELLTDEGVYDADDHVDQPTKREMVKRAIDDLVTQSQEYYGTKKTQITRNVGRAAFLHSYIAGEDEEGLRQVIAELGWTRGHNDLDALAVSSLTVYPKLLREIAKAQHTPAELELSEMELPEADLDESILDAIERGRIPRGYGGMLRLYMGRVDAPASTPPEVLHAVYSQAGGKLKIDMTRRQKVNDVTPQLSKGFLFLERYVAGFDMGTIAQEEYPVAKRSEEGLAEAIRRVEVLMAHALEELYR